jgi:hypothetical protein
MVVDEVQTGFGRTGKLFAIEHYGIEPDLITVAKSIAAGLPLSGVIGKAEIMDAPGDSAIGGTYVGNPVAQAAALAVLDVIEDEGVCEPRRSARRDDSSPDGSRGGSAGRRSATSAASARCWRSSSSRSLRARSRTPTPRRRSSRRPPRAGCCCSSPASTRTASACWRRSSSRTAELDEALRCLEEALESVLS